MNLTTLYTISYAIVFILFSKVFFNSSMNMLNRVDKKDNRLLPVIPYFHPNNIIYYYINLVTPHKLEICFLNI